ncbi:MAG: ABC transporter ATP-binding protein [Rhodospirillales bacterium]|nr:ABC transporter ATP-binding protein [Rhodospirillales bacterium]
MSLLQTRSLEAFYGDFQALFGIDMTVEAGETVAIIGANGAGKSTFLKALCGLMPGLNGEVRFDGLELGDLTAHAIVRLGLALVPEGRKLFQSLSVEENLLIGAHTKRPGPWTLETVYGLFPMLHQRRHAPGTDLSGGQQQMVAIGRALMSNPKLLLCDELSLGLAPVVIKDIYEVLPEISAQGSTVIIVEQDINQAMAVSDKLYCLQEGRVTLQGHPDSVTRDQITQAYFGMEQA